MADEKNHSSRPSARLLHKRSDGTSWVLECERSGRVCVVCYFPAFSAMNPNRFEVWEFLRDHNHTIAGERLMQLISALAD